MRGGNVVGYQNVGLVDGAKLVGAAFNTVAQQTISLDEIVPVGYENDQDLIEYLVEATDGWLTGNEFQFYIVTDVGSIASEYQYLRQYDASQNKWLDNGYWSLYSGEPITEIHPGEGLFATCGWHNDGTGFMVAGEALVEARNIPFKEGAFIMSLPLAKPVALSDIWPIGYENDQDLIEYLIEATDGWLTGNEYQFYIVTDAGSIAAEYQYLRQYDGNLNMWKDNGYWSLYSGAEITTINPGDALFTTCGWWTESAAMSFPGLDDSRAE